MGKPVSFSLVVPVYNEGHNIVSNIVNMTFKLRDLIYSNIINDYEIVVLWGLSNSLPLLNDLQRLNLRNVLIYECEYPELGSMFKRGISLAKKEYVGLISPYNQVDLDSLGNILDALSNHDIVVAYIGNFKTRPWYREVASGVNTKIVNCLFGLKLRYYHLNFYRTALVKKVPFTTDNHAAMVEAAVWTAKSGVSLAQVPFTMIPHNFKSKSRAFRTKNVVGIFKTYAWLFWRVMILRKRINLN